jgi:hypothetical protein
LSRGTECRDYKIIFFQPYVQSTKRISYT